MKLLPLFFTILPAVLLAEEIPDPPVLPEKESVILDPIAAFQHKDIKESSGIVRSPRWGNYFWTHNDSGGKARIFAVRRDGTVAKPLWENDYEGLEVEASWNIDWEDIAVDGDGNLIIADCGNNTNARRDMGLYIVREPHPGHVAKTRALQWIPFEFAEQKGIPAIPSDMNYDCEAVFFARGKIHLLTKHRNDAGTKLYRMDTLDTGRVNRPALVGRYTFSDYKNESGGGFTSHPDAVTAADSSPDGKRIVVLTYGAIWMFEPPAEAENLLSGKVSWLPIMAGKCEAICFADEKTLMLTNEQGGLFEVAIEDLVRVEGSE